MKPAPDLATRLSAYRDGELPEAKARAVEALMKDPEVRAAYDDLLRADDAFDRAFEAMLHQPVPAALARAVERAETLPPPANRPYMPLWGAGLAAAVAMLMIGGVGGAYLMRTMGQAEQVAAGWLDQVAQYHLVYAGQQRHMVEVPASEKDHLQTWLGDTTGVPFRVPNLSASGLTFQGARLLVAAGKPVAQLVYTDPMGQVIAICFIDGGDAALGEGVSGFVQRSVGGVDMVSWKSGDASYVVVGPEGASSLNAVAETAARLL